MSFGVWDVLAVAAKAVTYAATLGSAGGVFFLAYTRALLEDRDERAIRRLVEILIIVSLSASGARILLTAASMSGETSGLLDSGLTRMIWQGGEGRALLVRAAGLLIAAPAVIWHRRPMPLTLAAAGVAASSFAWVGHVHALKAAVPTLLIVVHLLSVAFWVGALGPLWLVAGRDGTARVAAAAARFGRTAVVVVSALIVAGVCLLSMLLGGVSELWSSGYGRWLTLKLGLVACLLGFAAYNKLGLTPRLLAGDSSAMRGLRRSICAEMILGSLILTVTAAFTTLTGPPALE